MSSAYAAAAPSLGVSGLSVKPAIMTVPIPRPGRRSHAIFPWAALLSLLGLIAPLASAAQASKTAVLPSGFDCFPSFLATVMNVDKLWASANWFVSPADFMTSFNDEQQYSEFILSNVKESWMVDLYIYENHSVYNHLTWDRAYGQSATTYHYEAQFVQTSMGSDIFLDRYRLRARDFLLSSLFRYTEFFNSKVVFHPPSLAYTGSGAFVDVSDV
ncbi:uncharacterized protein G6M90_00g011880 [Metarhizium brunneum]|uniref:Uncharacterized protein n=1 Tax=Metarhizium brunneum TaxID=500148 RepID=A0A7D5YZ83_9HYPO